MTQSTIQEDGRLVEVTLIIAVESGDVVQQRQLIGIAITSGEIGDKISIDTQGVHILPAITTIAFIVGEELHWDGSVVTNVVSTNALIGTVYKSKGISEDKVQVKLHSILTSLGGTVDPSEIKGTIVGGIITFKEDLDGDTITPGNTGQVLTSNGPGAEPTYQDSVGGTVELSEVTDTDHGGVVIINSSGAGDTISADTIGKVLTANGPGSAPSFKVLPTDSIGANAALSNLASVAINTALLPVSDKTIDLGNASASKRFKDVHADTGQFSSSVTTASLSSTTLALSSFADFTEISEPATPTANKVRVYGAEVSGASTLKLKDDAGDIIDLINDFTTRSQEANNTIKFDNEFGTANVYRVAASFAGATVTTGRLFYFIASNTNTGAATFIVNSIPAIPILKNNDAVLAAGDIEVGQALVLMFDGSNYQMISPTSVLGISALIDDITPQLGGDLDLNTNNITQDGTNILSGTSTIDSVNYFNIQTARTGRSPIFHATGPDTDINMRIHSKGTGSFIVFGSDAIGKGDLFVFDSSLLITHTGVYSFQLPDNYNKTKCVFPLTSTTLIGDDTTNIVTNKAIDADFNTITNIGSSEIKSEIITGQTSSTVVATDNFIFSKASDSGALKIDTVQGIIDLAGDMFLADSQTITGVKTFNDNTFVLNGSTSGTSILNANAVAGATVFTLPDSTGTLALTSDIGNTTGTLHTITTYTLSAESQILITDDMDSAFDDYVIEGNLLISANNQTLFIELSEDNGSSFYNLKYRFIQIGSGVIGNDGKGNSTTLYIASHIFSGGQIDFSISIKDALASINHTIRGSSAWLAVEPSIPTNPTPAVATFTSSNDVVSQINAIKITIGSGTMTGKVHMKGIVK